MATDFGGSCPPVPPPGVTKPSPQHDLSLALTIFLPIILIGFTWTFWVFQNESVFLRKRPVKYIIMHVISFLPTWAVSVLYDYLGSENYPCWLFMLLGYIAWPIANVPSILIVLKYSNEVAALRLKRFALENGGTELNLKPEASFATFRGFISVALCHNRTEESRILNAKFTKTIYAPLFWGTLIILPYPLIYFIRLILNPQWAYCRGCEFTNFEMIFFLVGNNLALIIATIANSSRVRRRDALRLIREWMINWWVCGAILNLVFILFLTDPGGVYVSGTFDWKALFCVCPVMSVYLETIHQIRVSRQLKRKLLLMQNIGREDRFEDVMHDKVLASKLRAFLDAELSPEILQFLSAVQEYKTNYEKDGTQEKAKEIFDKYILRGSPLEINIGSDLRQRLCEHRTVGNVNINAFDEAYGTIKQNLLVDGFARFLQKLAKSEDQVTPLRTSKRDTQAAKGSVIPVLTFNEPPA